MSVTDSYFENLFEHSDDPWSFKKRWYERRKRALTLATLPRQRYRSAFEPGCANGELSAELAARCDQLLVCDTSKSAVELARKRLAQLDNVQVLHARLPQQWPEAQFDLIVFSELGYYLDEHDLNLWIDRAVASLTDDGQLLACHWRPDIDGCPLTARVVHDRLSERLQMHHMVSHHEDDFLLDVWSRDATSVAAKEGLQ